MNGFKHELLFVNRELTLQVQPVKEQASKGRQV